MKYNLANRLIHIDTDLKNIYYCPYVPLLDDIIKGETKYGVKFAVKNDVSRPKKLNQKFEYYWGRDNEKQIYYEHPLLPGVKGKLLLDMSNNKYSITVNNDYYFFARYKFENVLPPGQHLTNLITLKLLENSFLTLHCGAFSDKNTKKGYLVLGASNTGKSYTTFKALNKGFQYHSEDLTILDIDNIYTTPLISGQSDKLPNKNFALKYNLFIYKMIGINAILPKIPTKMNFRKFFNTQDIDSVSSLNKIFILEKGQNSIHKLNKNESIRKMQILNRMELSYMKDPLLLAYSYFNKSFSVQNLVEKENKLISQIATKSEIFLVRSNIPGDYFDLISKLI